MIKEFLPSSKDLSDARIARNECEEYCSTDEACWGCSVYCTQLCQWNAIPDCGIYEKWTGLIEGDVTKKPC